MKTDFDEAERPERLYSLIDGADSPPEDVFADRVTRNLRDGRIHWQRPPRATIFRELST